MIDAYLHCGGPRFGSADLALRELDRHAITHGNLVLPPACPDFAALRRARELRGESVRLVGIPFGDTDARRAELTAWQLSFGILGLRLMPNELVDNPSSLDLVGQAGRWLFAINPYDNPATVRTLLAWLDRHPSGRVICPHFFKPGRIDAYLADPAAFRELLRHPRLFVILSRQGNTGTTKPYPHPDLLPWVEDVVAETGWEKVMWGSEYPVLYWRDETIPQCARWLRDLLPSLDDATLAAFTDGNARHLFFSSPAHRDDAGPLPSWFAPDLAAGRPTPVAQKGLKLPSDVTEKLFARFLDERASVTPPPTFSDWLSGWIEKRVV